MVSTLQINKVSVIIPVSRQTTYLDEILSLNISPPQTVEFIVVLDRKSDKLRNWILRLKETRQENLILIENPQNLGAPQSRNRGIEASSGELIVFLDDDVIPEPNLLDQHLDAVTSGNFCGAVGSTRISLDPKIILQRAIDKTGYTYAFTMSEKFTELSWGPTCNLSVVQNKHTSGQRFDQIFPAAGGGEDVDYAWRISKLTGQKFKAVPTANVIHPPWQGVQNNLKRFFRWGQADVPLFLRHPDHRYRDFPNYIEFYFLLFFILLGFGYFIGYFNSFLLLFSTLLISIPICAIIWGRLLYTDPVTGFHCHLINVSHEFGRFLSIFKHLAPYYIFCRTLYFDGDYPWRTRRQTLFILSSNILALFLSIILWWVYNGFI